MLKLSLKYTHTHTFLADENMISDRFQIRISPNLESSPIFTTHTFIDKVKSTMYVL